MAEPRDGRQPVAVPNTSNPEHAVHRVPDATVNRLPIYLRCLGDAARSGSATISSERLAERAGVNAAKVRKDLSYLGSYGTRGVGYDVEFLLFQIRRQLGLTHDWPVILAGAGNLGRALANYGGFGERGFPVAAIVDSDPTKYGDQVGNLGVEPMDELVSIVAERDIRVGVIATPASVAQGVADQLCAAGVTSILNFAPVVVTGPAHVRVRQVDLASELQILSFYEEQDEGRLGLNTPSSAG
ncbi:MAG: redox-sensing transcriptional repressor Rex [Actinomycetia bacterium]|nr:redox-sensing transcriptional repressor Rex [Actinomycetes bacterium]